MGRPEVSAKKLITLVKKILKTTMLISMGLPWTPKGVAGKGGGTKENEGSEKVKPTISKDFCSMIIHGENELTKMNKTPRLFHKNCLGE